MLFTIDFHASREWVLLLVGDTRGEIIRDYEG